MRSELIVATYNKPAYLHVVLSAVPEQTVLPDSVCIADDGSGKETAAVIAAFQAEHPSLAVRHIWHPDTGFEKNRILNKAIATSDCEHLIFIDDDCVMHPHFVARHRARAHPKRYMAGSVIRLTEEVTRFILAHGQATWSADGRLMNWTPRKLSERMKSYSFARGLMPLFDRLSPVKKNWAGGNASAFRAALCAVNGFDETMKYGGEDKELGARLENNGIKGCHIRYTAPLYHLDHGRGYVDPDLKAANRVKINQVRKDGTVWTPHGISQGQPDLT